MVGASYHMHVIFKSCFQMKLGAYFLSKQIKCIFCFQIKIYAQFGFKSNKMHALISKQINFTFASNEIKCTFCFQIK